jgi:hypothetical protein
MVLNNINISENNSKLSDFNAVIKLPGLCDELIFINNYIKVKVKN